VSYLLARLRLWAAHHRVIWWTCAAALAGLTGVTVRAATNAEPCVAAPETSPADGPLATSGAWRWGAAPTPCQ